MLASLREMIIHVLRGELPGVYTLISIFILLTCGIILGASSDNFSDGIIHAMMFYAICLLLVMPIDPIELIADPRNYLLNLIYYVIISLLPDLFLGFLLLLLVIKMSLRLSR